MLATAGLVRLGRTAAITESFGPGIMLPAPAQGALAVECRAADFDTVWYAALVRAVDSRADPGRRNRRTQLLADVGGRLHRAGRRRGIRHGRDADPDRGGDRRRRRRRSWPAI